MQVFDLGVCDMVEVKCLSLIRHRPCRPRRFVTVYVGTYLLEEGQVVDYIHH